MSDVPGKLYLVSLPIGNLQDITLRGLEVLTAVSAIVAEDTRQIAKFLQLRQMPHKQLISYREQNHTRVAASLIELLHKGQDLALVSDRGTPTISDPGFRLVQAAVAAGIEIVTVPGPSAAIAALSISGLPTDRFLFLGFLPRTAGKQQQILRQAAAAQATIIIYESPFRIYKLLEALSSALGDVQVALAHELTKSHEQVFRGSVSQVQKLLGNRKLKGEWVVLADPRSLSDLNQ